MKLNKREKLEGEKFVHYLCKKLNYDIEKYYIGKFPDIGRRLTICIFNSIRIYILRCFGVLMITKTDGFKSELVIYFSAPKLFGSTVKGMSVLCVCVCVCITSRERSQDASFLQHEN